MGEEDVRAGLRDAVADEPPLRLDLQELTAAVRDATQLTAVATDPEPAL